MSIEEISSDNAALDSTEITTTQARQQNITRKQSAKASTAQQEIVESGGKMSSQVTKSSGEMQMSTQKTKAAQRTSVTKKQSIVTQQDEQSVAIQSISSQSYSSEDASIEIEDETLMEEQREEEEEVDI